MDSVSQMTNFYSEDINHLIITILLLPFTLYRLQVKKKNAQNYFLG